VKDHENDLYQGWRKGDNVYFSGKLADALGEFLGKRVEKVGKGDGEIDKELKKVK